MREGVVIVVITANSLVMIEAEVEESVSLLPSDPDVHRRSAKNLTES